MSIPRLRTISVMAAELGQPVERVDYVIRTRGIREIARAGQTRLFSADEVARVRHELNAIDARREGGFDG